MSQEQKLLRKVVWVLGRAADELERVQAVLILLDMHTEREAADAALRAVDKLRIETRARLVDAAPE